MREEVLKIISKTAKVDIVEIEKNINQKGLWDSFSHLEIILEVEERFDIMLSPDEIASLNTPLNIINFLKENQLK
jgi:acyl carrier protein